MLEKYRFNTRTQGSYNINLRKGKLNERLSKRYCTTYTWTWFY